MTDEEVWELVRRGNFAEPIEGQFFCRDDVQLRIIVEDVLGEDGEQQLCSDPWTKKFENEDSRCTIESATVFYGTTAIHEVTLVVVDDARHRLPRPRVKTMEAGPYAIAVGRVVNPSPEFEGYDEALHIAGISQAREES